MEETLEAKQAYQQHSLDKGVIIRAYHADNGIFKANDWQNACMKEGQKLIFAGVNAHFTNGLAEKRIRDLQDLTRTLLIHASIKWKHCITANIWPYAMRMANDAMNNSPSLQDINRRTPEQIFSKTNANMNAKHFKPCGCPVYVLDSALQQNSPYQK